MSYFIPTRILQCSDEEEKTENPVYFFFSLMFFHFFLVLSHFQGHTPQTHKNHEIMLKLMTLIFPNHFKKIF